MDKMLALLSSGTAPGKGFMGLFMDRLPVLSFVCKTTALRGSLQQQHI
jgi:hypothetical protein